MAEKYPKRVNSKIGLKTWEIIKEHSEKTKTSMSEIIRRALVEYAKSTMTKEGQEL